MGNEKDGKSRKDSERLVVKLTRRRKNRYEGAAAIEDLSLSEWVRRVLDEASGELLASPESVLEPNPVQMPRDAVRSVTPPARTLERHGDYVLAPVIGRTSAGPARYWSDLNFTDSGVISRIERRLSDLAGIVPRQSQAGALCRLERSEVLAVSLIQYSVPDQQGILEFLSIPKPEGLQQAVAWRVDGDSMSPQYLDGDFVIVSPEIPAEDAAACVAHQIGQLGVNCKIFRRIGNDIYLIPVNEKYETQQISADQLDWAFRVLSRVRLTGTESVP